jgi:hypothetical protein
VLRSNGRAGARLERRVAGTRDGRIKRGYNFCAHSYLLKCCSASLAPTCCTCKSQSNPDPMEWTLRSKDGIFYSVRGLPPNRAESVLAKAVADNPQLGLKYKVHGSRFTLRWTENSIEGTSSAATARAAVETALAVPAESSRIIDDAPADPVDPPPSLQVAAAEPTPVVSARVFNSALPLRSIASAGSRVSLARSFTCPSCRLAFPSATALASHESEHPLSLRPHDVTDLLPFAQHLLRDVFLEWVPPNDGLWDTLDLTLRSVRCGQLLTEKLGAAATWLPLHPDDRCSKTLLARTMRLLVVGEGVCIALSKDGSRVLNIEKPPKKLHDCAPASPALIGVVAATISRVMLSRAISDSRVSEATDLRDDDDPEEDDDELARAYGGGWRRRIEPTTGRSIVNGLISGSLDILVQSGLRFFTPSACVLFSLTGKVAFAAWNVSISEWRSRQEILEARMMRRLG